MSKRPAWYFDLMRRPVILDRRDQNPDLKPTESRWIVRYWTQTGDKRKRFQRKKDAEAFQDQIIRDHDGTRTFDPDRGKGVYVADLHDQWITALEGGGGLRGDGAERSTINSYRSIYRNVIEPRWDRTALANIGREDVHQWVQTMTSADGAPATADRKRKALGQFKRMLAFAVERGILTVNPAEKVKGPTATARSDIRVLTPRQLIRLAAFAGDWSDLILFTGMTGLRFGEVAALQVRDVDAFEHTVTVERALGDDNGKKFVKSTKTGEGRTAPLAPNALRIASGRSEGKAATDILFPATGGGWLHGPNFTNRIFRPVVQDASAAVERLQAALGVTELRRGRARFGEATQDALRIVQETNGLPVTGEADGRTRAVLDLDDHAHDYTLRLTDEDFEPITFHTLRHTAVSLAIQAGANVKAVQRFAGHSSASMTLDVYSHLFDDDLRTVSDRLGVLFEQASRELAD